MASTIVGDDVVIFTASVLASRWPKISPVVAEMMVSYVKPSLVKPCQALSSLGEARRDQARGGGGVVMAFIDDEKPRFFF